MSVFDAVLAQYEKSKSAASGNNNKMSSEERLKKFFTTVLPKGSKGEERRIRILPTSDGSSPFKEVYFHEIQVDGKWVKLYDPAQEGKRSPLNEVREGLQMMGDEQSKELAKSYRSRKFFIVKVIDRDNEQDGPKFWRFKHNTKQEGIFDKIFPIFRNKGDITDPAKGRDLILSLSLTKSGTGKEYTVVNSILNDDPSPLSADDAQLQAWVNDPMVWSDVYAKKSEDYLELVAKGEVPKWDDNLKKFVSTTTSEETIAAPKSSAPVADPQEDAEVDDDLPF